MDDGILKSTSPDITRNNDLNPVERAFVAGLHDGGIKPFGDRCRVEAPSTVYSALQRMPSQHEFETNPCTRRPRKLFRKRELDHMIYQAGSLRGAYSLCDV